MRTGPSGDLSLGSPTPAGDYCGQRMMFHVLIAARIKKAERQAVYSPQLPRQCELRVFSPLLPLSKDSPF